MIKCNSVANTIQSNEHIDKYGWYEHIKTINEYLIGDKQRKNCSHPHSRSSEIARTHSKLWKSHLSFFSSKNDWKYFFFAKYQFWKEKYFSSTYRNNMTIVEPFFSCVPSNELHILPSLTCTQSLKK